jgi:predicted RNase H-like nuclease (RuvC/YqgF family)
MDWISIVALIISVLSGPIVLTAVNAVHERKTAKLISDALKEKEEALMNSHERAATKLIEEALEKERERSKELFALKHEVAEMKGHVMQLVTNTSALDAKLDKMSDLLMELRRAR